MGGSGGEVGFRGFWLLGFGGVEFREWGCQGYRNTYGGEFRGLEPEGLEIYGFRV